MVQTTPNVPPVEKLPLAARKDIRDEYEANIEDLTKQVSDMLHEPYKLEVNFNQFYAYGAAADSSYAKSSPGSAAKAYFEGFVDYLKKFTEEGQYEEGIQAFNDLITDRRIVLEADNQFSYSGCSVKNGIFEINYNSKCPGTNISYACSELAKQFDEGLFAKNPLALPLIARRGLRDDWENDKEEAALTKIKDQLLGAEGFKFKADYEQIWKTIVEGKKKNKDVDLESASRNFGYYMNSYFGGVVDQIEYQFKKDDMMVEGFVDAVSSKEIWLEVVEETKAGLKNTYSECEIKDGKLYLRTIPRYWGTNTYSVAEKLTDML